MSEQPLTADPFSTKSFNLETGERLWAAEPVASWQRWLLLGFVSAGGSEPRRSPASETALALPLRSWAQMTLQCISFPGTDAFLLFPWRPPLGRREVTAHQVLTSVWVLDARSANALSWAACRVRTLGENSQVSGMVLQKETDLLNLAPH